MRSTLGRVRGLGSAKEGSEHFWIQRVMAVALIPLSIWFAISVISLVGASYHELRLWMADPFNLTMMILFIAISCHHGQMGLQVVIEDYVHKLSIKVASLIVIKMATVFLGLFAIISVLKIAFGG